MRVTWKMDGFEQILMVVYKSAILVADLRFDWLFFERWVILFGISPTFLLFSDVLLVALLRIG